MKRTNGEILKFAIVGFANFLIIMATAWLLGEKLALHYMIANVCAYLLAFVNNFYWNRTWESPNGKCSASAAAGRRHEVSP